MRCAASHVMQNLIGKVTLLMRLAESDCQTCQPMMDCIDKMWACAMLLQVTSKRRRLGSQTLGCDVDEGGVVVSVMLPTRQALQTAQPSLTSVEQIYVVVLKPSKQYTTYACALPTAMYV